MVVARTDVGDRGRGRYCRCRSSARRQKVLGAWVIDRQRHVDRRNGSRANFMLTVAYRFGSGRSAVRERHCSNAGQTSDNKGLDMALYGRRL